MKDFSIKNIYQNPNRIISLMLFTAAGILSSISCFGLSLWELIVGIWAAAIGFLAWRLGSDKEQNPTKFDLVLGGVFLTAAILKLVVTGSFDDLAMYALVGAYFTHSYWVK